MTKDQIIAMAREADAGYGVQGIIIGFEHLKKFASLVAAQAAAEEREACAKACEAGMDHSMEERMKSKSIQLNGADGELEALKFWSTVSLYNNARRLCAVAIRERK